MIDYDVVVVGGGMVGLSFAIDFANKQAKKIAIINNNELNIKISDDFHSRVSAINFASEKYLKSLDVWSNIKRKRAFKSIKVWDQNSHGNINFNAKDEGLEHLGNIIENDIIQSALYKTIKTNNIKCIKANVVNIEKTVNSYKITTSNKKDINCSLLIAADGANSQIRKLANIECSENNYQQKAIVANISTITNFDNTISQRFLADSIIAILPLSNKLASIVWSCNDNIAQKLIASNDKNFAEKLNIATEYFFGELKLESKRLDFNLIQKSAKSYALPNLALIGDSAHNIHPLAGQGVNLGFADAKILNEKLYENKNKALGDYSVLEQYSKARKIHNELMAKTMQGLNWIYKNNNESMRIIRGVGMNIVNESSIIKSFLQKQALGE